jgi:hypothetical protein
MEENPYQSPQVTGDLPARAGSIQLDGDALVVGSGAVLPPICIWTGEPVSGKRIRRWLDWCPNWVLWLAPIVPVAVLVYFLIRKRCVIEFSLDPEIVRWNKRRRRISLVVASVVWVVSVAIAFLIASPPPTFVACTVGIAFAALMAHQESTLQVVAYHDGLFRIKGFSATFLQRLEEQLDRDEDAPAA